MVSTVLARSAPPADQLPANSAARVLTEGPETEHTLDGILHIVKNPNFMSMKSISV